ncbi:MAG TPA: hydrogen peroxide-inducible genes activator [Saprospiraceae bacterium]|nr:hydrogen peroxide-inducible genes activator [Saprospiraceae bacterium]
MNFSIAQLRYLIALDRHRNYVRAAESCYVTQPTMSMQIKKLENELGVVLFDRSKKPLMPTAIGEKTISKARAVLAEVAGIEDMISEYRDRIAGELKLGVIPSVSPYLIPRFLGTFADKFPEVKLEIRELLTENLIEQLRRGNIDIGIMVTPLDEEGILEIPLYYERMLVYVHKDHPFSELDSLRLDEVNTEDLWLMSQGNCFRSQVLNLCASQNPLIRDKQVYYESGSLETIKRLIESEGGWTIVPELAVDDYLSDRVAVRRIEEPSPLREVSLVYSRYQSKQRLIGFLKEEIRESIPKKMLEKDRGTVVEWNT